MTEVHRFNIQIARPMGPNDPGSVEYGCYVVSDGAVTLTDESGKGLLRTGSAPSARGSASVPTRWERKLRPGEAPLQVARELLWAKYKAGKRGNDFNRPLNWPRGSIV